MPEQSDKEDRPTCAHVSANCHLVYPCCAKPHACAQCHAESACPKSTSGHAAPSHVVCHSCGKSQAVPAAPAPAPTTCPVWSCRKPLAGFACGPCSVWDAAGTRHCDECGFCVRSGLVHCNACKRCVGDYSGDGLKHICSAVGVCALCDKPFVSPSSDTIVRSECSLDMMHASCLEAAGELTCKGCTRLRCLEDAVEADIDKITGTDAVFRDGVGGTTCVFAADVAADSPSFFVPVRPLAVAASHFTFNSVGTATRVRMQSEDGTPPSRFHYDFVGAEWPPCVGFVSTQIASSQDLKKLESEVLRRGDPVEGPTCCYLSSRGVFVDFSRVVRCAGADDEAGRLQWWMEKTEGGRALHLTVTSPAGVGAPLYEECVQVAEEPQSTTHWFAAVVGGWSGGEPCVVGGTRSSAPGTDGDCAPPVVFSTKAGLLSGGAVAGPYAEGREVVVRDDITRHRTLRITAGLALKRWPGDAASADLYMVAKTRYGCLRRLCWDTKSSFAPVLRAESSSASADTAAAERKSVVFNAADGEDVPLECGLLPEGAGKPESADKESAWAARCQRFCGGRLSAAERVRHAAGAVYCEPPHPCASCRAKNLAAAGLPRAPAPLRAGDVAVLRRRARPFAAAAGAAAAERGAQKVVVVAVKGDETCDVVTFPEGRALLGVRQDRLQLWGRDDAESCFLFDVGATVTSNVRPFVDDRSRKPTVTCLSAVRLAAPDTSVAPPLFAVTDRKVVVKAAGVLKKLYHVTPKLLCPEPDPFWDGEGAEANSLAQWVEEAELAPLGVLKGSVLLATAERRCDGVAKSERVWCTLAAGRSVFRCAACVVAAASGQRVCGFCEDLTRRNNEFVLTSQPQPHDKEQPYAGLTWGDGSVKAGPAAEEAAEEEAAPVEASPPAVLDEFWACDVCTFNNPRAALRCDMCSSPNLEAVKEAEAKAAEAAKAETAAAAADPDKWVCPACTFANPLDAARCEVCLNTDREESTTWQCRSCTYICKGTSTVCESCGVARPEEEVEAPDTPSEDAEAPPAAPERRSVYAASLAASLEDVQQAERIRVAKATSFDEAHRPGTVFFHKMLRTLVQVVDTEKDLVRCRLHGVVSGTLDFLRPGSTFRTSAEHLQIPLPGAAVAAAREQDAAGTVAVALNTAKAVVRGGRVWDVVEVASETCTLSLRGGEEELVLSKAQVTEWLAGDSELRLTSPLPVGTRVVTAAPGFAGDPAVARLRDVFVREAKASKDARGSNPSSDTKDAAMAYKLLCTSLSQAFVGVVVTYLPEVDSVLVYFDFMKAYHVVSCADCMSADADDGAADGEDTLYSTGETVHTQGAFGIVVRRLSQHEHTGAPNASDKEEKEKEGPWYSVFSPLRCAVSRVEAGDVEQLPVYLRGAVLQDPLRFFPLGTPQEVAKKLPDLRAALERRDNVADSVPEAIRRVCALFAGVYNTPLVVAEKGAPLFLATTAPAAASEAIQGGRVQARPPSRFVELLESVDVRALIKEYVGVYDWWRSLLREMVEKEPAAPPVVVDSESCLNLFNVQFEGSEFATSLSKVHAAKALKVVQPTEPSGLLQKQAIVWSLAQMFSREPGVSVDDLGAPRAFVVQAQAREYGRLAACTPQAFPRRFAYYADDAQNTALFAYFADAFADLVDASQPARVTVGGHIWLDRPRLPSAPNGLETSLGFSEEVQEKAVALLGARLAVGGEALGSALSTLGVHDEMRHLLTAAHCLLVAARDAEAARRKSLQYVVSADGVVDAVVCGDGNGAPVRLKEEEDPQSWVDASVVDTFFTGGGGRGGEGWKGVALRTKSMHAKTYVQRLFKTELFAAMLPAVLADCAAGKDAEKAAKAAQELKVSDLPLYTFETLPMGTAVTAGKESQSDEKCVVADVFFVVSFEGKAEESAVAAARPADVAAAKADKKPSKKGCSPEKLARIAAHELKMKGKVKKEKGPLLGIRVTDVTGASFSAAKGTVVKLVRVKRLVELHLFDALFGTTGHENFDGLLRKRAAAVGTYRPPFLLPGVGEAEDAPVHAPGRPDTSSIECLDVENYCSDYLPDEDALSRLRCLQHFCSVHEFLYPHLSGDKGGGKFRQSDPKRREKGWYVDDDVYSALSDASSSDGSDNQDLDDVEVAGAEDESSRWKKHFFDNVGRNEWLQHTPFSPSFLLNWTPQLKKLVVRNPDYVSDQEYCAVALRCNDPADTLRTLEVRTVEPNSEAADEMCEFLGDFNLPLHSLRTLRLHTVRNYTKHLPKCLGVLPNLRRFESEHSTCLHSFTTNKEEASKRYSFLASIGPLLRALNGANELRSEPKAIRLRASNGDKGFCSECVAVQSCDEKDAPVFPRELLRMLEIPDLEEVTAACLPALAALASPTLTSANNTLRVLDCRAWDKVYVEGEEDKEGEGKKEEGGEAGAARKTPSKPAPAPVCILGKDLFVHFDKLSLLTVLRLSNVEATEPAQLRSLFGVERNLEEAVVFVTERTMAVVDDTVLLAASRNCRGLLRVFGFFHQQGVVQASWPKTHNKCSEHGYTRLLRANPHLHALSLQGSPHVSAQYVERVQMTHGAALRRLFVAFCPYLGEEQLEWLRKRAPQVALYSTTRCLSTAESLEPYTAKPRVREGEGMKVEATDDDW
eukprot:Rhum_TRINITY_DN12328_c0_g1::Rhum_TRINITY_DN12328_c0_g1_i1::g.51198::m.51198